MWRMTNARNHPRFSIVLVAVFPLLSLLLTAQEKKESSYTVRGKAVISITNDYGPITVKPSGNRQVVVQTVSRSDAISFANEQHSNRIEIRSVSSSQRAGLVDYTVLVPADAFVTLRTSDGTLRAQGLRGDIILEGATASVEVIAISDAHLHVRTLSGPITLADIRNSHLDVHSVSGNVSIHNVTGPSVKVNSGRGRITYEGDPGPVGEYLLTSHSGDLEILIPASASVDIKARSIKGQSDEEFPKPRSASALGQGNLLMKPGTLSRSRFELRSFSGKIRLKRP
jgi:putative adhesin